MQIELRKSEVNDLISLPNTIKATMHSKIAELANFPNAGNIKKLTNFEPAYRLRIGNHQILFAVEGEKVIIGRVLHRKESYR